MGSITTSGLDETASRNALWSGLMVRLISEKAVG
jgi:hypothetical protein